MTALVVLVAVAVAAATAIKDDECNPIPQANCVSGTKGLAHCGSEGTVHCLGNFSTLPLCETACSEDSTCRSWAYYYPDTKSAAYRGLCFGRFDDAWDPKVNISISITHVSSGKRCGPSPPPSPSPPPAPPSPGPPAPPVPVPPPVPSKPPAPVDPDLLPVALLGGETFNGSSTESLNVTRLCKLQVVAVINSYCWSTRDANNPLCTKATDEVSNIIGASRIIKARCPTVLTQMYLNSMMNFWWYTSLFDRFTGTNESLLLHDANGELVRVRQDGGEPNITVFDWGQNATRAMYLEVVDAALASGITSFFLDKASTIATPAGQICNHVCAQLAPKVADAWTAGHYEVLRAIALRSTGPTGGNGGLNALVPIMGGGGADNFRPSADAAGIEMLKTALATPHANTIFAKFPFKPDGYGAFLMGYEQGRAFMWDYAPPGAAGIWMDQFDRPLGAPLGPAVLNAAGVYSRKFVHGAVTFDTSTNTAHFEWI